MMLKTSYLQFSNNDYSVLKIQRHYHITSNIKFIYLLPSTTRMWTVIGDSYEPERNFTKTPLIIKYTFLTYIDL
jgi:hypothetical protein